MCGSSGRRAREKAELLVRLADELVYVDTGCVPLSSGDFGLGRWRGQAEAGSRGDGNVGPQFAAMGHQDVSAD
jgi:hypothetical protein